MNNGNWPAGMTTRHCYRANGNGSIMSSKPFMNQGDGNDTNNEEGKGDERCYSPFGLVCELVRSTAAVTRKLYCNVSRHYFLLSIQYYTDVFISFLMEC